MWDAVRLDLRHAFRTLRRAPAFSLIVIVTLTAAVGATAAIGSLLNALLFRTLEVPRAILLATVLAASLLPALRASRAAPLDAVRED